MNTGVYSTISLNQIVASAKFMLNLGDTADSDIFIEKLANEGVRHLDALSIFVKRQCTLDITENKSKLPNGFHHLLGLRVNGGFNCASLFYVNQPFLTNCGCSTLDGQTNIQNGVGIFQIQNGYIYYSSGISITDPVTEVVTTATSVECAFIGLNVDDDGLMCVRSDMERGLVAYVCYMYMLSNADKYPAGLWNEHKNTWIAQKEWIKSMDVQNDFRNTKRQVMSLVNAWITDKNFWL